MFNFFSTQNSLRPGMLVLGLMLFAGMILLTGCSEASSQQTTQVKLVLTGSSTVAPLVAEIGKRFESLHPEVRVNVQTGGSSRGVRDAREGLADIGMASRDLKPSEQDMQSFLIAHDGIGIILHKSNSVAALTRQQIIQIYTGKITNWKTFNGKDRSIVIVHKAEGHSTLELFLKYFKLKNTQVKPSVIIGDNEQGIKFVAGNPDALGYVSIGAAEYAEKHGTPLKLLPLEGVPATTAAVQQKRYPFGRPLNLITTNQPSEWAVRFIAFTQSTEVDDLVKDFHYVPIH